MESLPVEVDEGGSVDDEDETVLAVFIESADSFCSWGDASAEIEKAADSPKRATSFALVLGLSSPSFLTMRCSMCIATGEAYCSDRYFFKALLQYSKLV